MDARKARRRWGLLIACSSIVLAGWTVNVGRAESPAAEDTSSGQISGEGRRGVVITTEGGLAHRVLAGLVAFNPPDVPPIPPDVPPAGTPPDNPPPPDNPVAPVYPPDIAPDFNLPDIPPATGAPEPGSLVIGLIGSICASAGVWRRRLMQLVK